MPYRNYELRKLANRYRQRTHRLRKTIRTITKYGEIALEHLKTGEPAKAEKKIKKIIAKAPKAKAEKQLEANEEAGLSIPITDTTEVYSPEICSHLRNLEMAQVPADFLLGSDLTPELRAEVVDGLVRAQIWLQLHSETLYTTVGILDNFLSKATVTKDQLQLVGTAAMFLAARYEEEDPPGIEDFTTIKAFPEEDVLNMATEMLKTIEFQLGRPLPLLFLRRFSKAAGADVVVHAMAKYFMELSLVEYQTANFKPSVLAASALWLAINLCKEDIKWAEKMAEVTKYEEPDLKPCVEMIRKTVIGVHSGQSKLQAVRDKYGTSKFLEISKHSCLNSK